MSEKMCSVENEAETISPDSTMSCNIVISCVEPNTPSDHECDDQGLRECNQISRDTSRKRRRAYTQHDQKRWMYAPPSRCGKRRVGIIQILLGVPGMSAHVNARTKYGETPLYKAVYYGREMVVRILLQESNVELNAFGNHGRIPLHISVCGPYVNIEIVRILLRAPGINVNAIDYDFTTPLHRAIDNGCSEVVQMLLQEPSIDVNFVDRFGRTPLYTAARQHNKSIVEMLLQVPDIDINVTANDGSTVLHAATRSYFSGNMKVLLKRLATHTSRRKPCRALQ